MSLPSPARQKAWRAGRWAEELCVMLLRLMGYRILARDLRTPLGEVDIVAQRVAPLGRVVIFVEVKARRNWRDALEALGQRQQQRISRAAAHFLAGHPDLAGLDARFDVMLVVPWRLPRHIVNAWGL